MERAAQVALLEGAAQVALLGRVAHTALLHPEQATRTALLVFSPPAAQAKTLSTPRVRALARAPIQAPSTNKFSSEASASSSCAAAAYLGSVARLIARGPKRWPSTGPGSAQPAPDPGAAIVGAALWPGLILKRRAVALIRNISCSNNLPRRLK